MMKSRVESALETAALVRSGKSRSYVRDARELSDFVHDLLGDGKAETFGRILDRLRLVQGITRELADESPSAHGAIAIRLADAFEELLQEVEKISGSV